MRRSKKKLRDVGYISSILLPHTHTRLHVCAQYSNMRSYKDARASTWATKNNWICQCIAAVYVCRE